MTKPTIYTVAHPEDLSPPVANQGFCVDVVLASDYAALVARMKMVNELTAVSEELTAEAQKVFQEQSNEHKREIAAYEATVTNLEQKVAELAAFIKQSCYVYNGDGSDISDSYIPAHESPMMPERSISSLPVAVECMGMRDAFIRYLVSENLSNNPDADEQRVYDHCVKWVDAMCKTPTTDAAIAEMRAQGVEMFALMLAETSIKRGETSGWESSASNAASDYAQQLRAEASK